MTVGKATVYLLCRHTSCSRSGFACTNPRLHGPGFHTGIAACCLVCVEAGFSTVAHGQVKVSSHQSDTIGIYYNSFACNLKTSGVPVPKKASNYGSRICHHGPPLRWRYKECVATCQPRRHANPLSYCSGEGGSSAGCMPRWQWATVELFVHVWHHGAATFTACLLCDFCLGHLRTFFTPGLCAGLCGLFVLCWKGDEQGAQAAWLLLCASARYLEKNRNHGDQ